MSAEGTFCGACGQLVTGGDSELGVPFEPGGHPDCELLLAYDPPRFCAVCGFRLDVQVLPGAVHSQCRRCRRRVAAADA
jgi:hypothetical protein